MKVIAPLSVLSSWLIECKKFCPTLRVVKLHSSDMAERERLKERVMNDFTSFDVVVTTYEMAKSKNMSGIVSRLWWRYVILDEGHIIKNEDSQISQAVRGATGSQHVPTTPDTNLFPLFSSLLY